MMKHTLTIKNDETALGGVYAVILVEKVGKNGGSSVLWGQGGISPEITWPLSFFSVSEPRPDELR